LHPRLIVLLVTVAAALAACGGSPGTGSATDDPATSTPVTPDPGATATAIAADPSPTAVLGQAYTCGQLPFDPALLGDPGGAETGDDPAAAALRAHLESEEGGPIILPMSGWIIAGESPDLIEFIAPRGDEEYAFVTIERRDGSWQVGGWGGCRPMAVIEGLSLATWNYAPDEMEPLAGTTSFDAVVTERACTGGQEMGERLLPPFITYGDAEITITFAARPLPGGRTCPGNPATRVTVVLDEPLGDRVLRDGAYFPSNDPAVIPD
jgi:hypothetical protein